MDAGRRHKSLGSELKDSLLLIAITVIRVLLFFKSVPKNLVPIGWHKEGQMRLAHAVGCIIGIAHKA